MRRRLLSVLLALFLLPVAATPVSAGRVLDQEALPGSSATSFGAAFASPIYQTFTAGLTGPMDTVSLHGHLGPFGGAGWEIAITAAPGGVPSGPNLATGAAAAPGSDAWTDIALSPSVSLTAGTQYAIVVTKPTPFWSDAAADYPGGTSSLGHDFAFRTFVAFPDVVPVISITVINALAATDDGEGSAALSAPTGSTVWRTIGVRNDSAFSLPSVALADSGSQGGLPASCPQLPAPFPSGDTYTCTFPVTVSGGATTYTVTARSGSAVTAVQATVTGTGGGIATGSKLGLPEDAGAYTPSTKVASVRGYVTWQASLGMAAAGKTVGVYVARKNASGNWGSWSRLTSRTADAAGVVTFAWRESAPAWLSVRFSLDGESYTKSAQARWR
jgi:hypothetical protein